MTSELLKIRQIIRISKEKSQILFKKMVILLFGKRSSSTIKKESKQQHFFVERKQSMTSLYTYTCINNIKETKKSSQVGGHNEKTKTILVGNQ